MAATPLGLRAQQLPFERLRRRRLPHAPHEHEGVDPGLLPGLLARAQRSERLLPDAAVVGRPIGTAHPSSHSLRHASAVRYVAQVFAVEVGQRSRVHAGIETVT